MGRKPKAGGAKGKTMDPEQSARFLEAAREAGVDETGKAFERAFERVATQGRPPADEDEGQNEPTRPGAARRKPASAPRPARTRRP